MCEVVISYSWCWSFKLMLRWIVTLRAMFSSFLIKMHRNWVQRGNWVSILSWRRDISMLRSLLCLVLKCRQLGSSGLMPPWITRIHCVSTLLQEALWDLICVQEILRHWRVELLNFLPLQKSTRKFEFGDLLKGLDPKGPVTRPTVW